YLALHPEAGDIMQGTGGIRKLRWKRGVSGKSKGVRVVYFYQNLKMPLFLLTIYANGEQDNLTKAERNNWRKMIELLANHYGE
ncbi:addiction module toxin RelE, partial [Thalassotalea sp. G20_0]|uniref:addiction module toxin RelE n=1 Tax=Thalassotalea sp. G20_0 TaxID=2821093 RepID=UPI0025704F8D